MIGLPSFVSLFSCLGGASLLYDAACCFRVIVADALFGIGVCSGFLARRVCGFWGVCFYLLVCGCCLVVNDIPRRFGI